MRGEWTMVFHDAAGAGPPEFLQSFAEGHDLSLLSVKDAEAVWDLVNRSLPAALVVDARSGPSPALELCSRIKADAFTAILPVLVLVPGDSPGLLVSALEAGSDEVIDPGAPGEERDLRLALLLRRARRDVAVHPTTRLPGTSQIERDLAGRLEAGAPFAFCYADLDHFKEFNDRYGYTRGDRVIFLVSLILRDLVRGLAPGGFAGHIGGDDFIFTVPLERMEAVCDEILELFDELIPFQYSEVDREAGYFLGRDRRGTLHRVPLMTLSIGVVTTASGHLQHHAAMSGRAAEMKSYAKTLPGSVYVVDRRHREPFASQRTVLAADLAPKRGEVRSTPLATPQPLDP